VTSGTISFTPTLLSRVGLPALTGTNTNATFAYLPNTFEIETGILSKGDIDTYNLTGVLFNVSGYVNDSVSGDGIPNATIYLTGGDIDSSVYSNASGYYIIPGLHSDDYILTATKDGFISGTVDFTINDADVTNANITMHYITDSEKIEQSYANSFILIGGIFVSILLIIGMYVVYSASTGNIKTSQKQLRELAYATIYIILFLVGGVMIAAIVFR